MDPTQILILDTRPLNHFIILNHWKKIFPESLVLHSYSIKEALELISNKLPELVLLSLPASKYESFFIAFRKLPQKIQSPCRIVIFNAYQENSPE